MGTQPLFLCWKFVLKDQQETFFFLKNKINLSFSIGG